MVKSHNKAPNKRELQLQAQDNWFVGLDVDLATAPPTSASRPRSTYMAPTGLRNPHISVTICHKHLSYNNILKNDKIREKRGK
ncbi:uncharacterized protein OCT59_009410 [Rhizophagus irregularis]|uniref:uncharacterized protein n=1 Tax=Rhizophagus irregularis TaxID=588596 RepID=UPI00332619B1|nr:hypothetical protein OCT59_009410 [Rhizophagus irregularis]